MADPLVIIGAGQAASQLMASLTQDGFQGEDASGRIVGRHKFTGLRPAFWDQAKYFGRERELAEIMGDDID